MMAFNCLAFAVLLLTVSASPVERHRRAAQHEYKMCVPDELMSDCQQMATEETKSAAKIICIPARDRMECLEKIHQHEADFGAVDPEDMYVASNYPEQDWNIFQEVRTKEEPDAEFRYEAVAVIHKELDINSVTGLKGLKSCHTGVGRNVGYKIPLTKLRKMGVIGGLNETELTPRENELKAFSTFFTKACIVGKWSADPEINKKLKKKYSNLCELCEHPEICDYPDKFSGYDGALRCLAHNGGEVAWTKVIYVRKFFGLPVGITPAEQSNEDASQFAYFCPDGSKVPITEEQPCRWAARPWQGFMANADVAKTIDELRQKITNLNNIGEKNHAHWLESVLVVNDKTVIKDSKMISPKDYLDKSNYTDVIEREYGPPVKVVRLCVTSDVENEKCKIFSKAAFSRDIRPRFECVQEASEHSCVKAIRDNAADAISLDAAFIETYREKFNLKPILTEEHEPSKGKYFAVAVVKKNSAIQSLEDLKGKKSCHSEYNNFASYRAPLYALIKAGLIKKSSCPYDKTLSEFFSGSCVPGVKLPEYEIDDKLSEKMCSVCGGNLDSNDSNPQDSKCAGDVKEAFHGYGGAFRCLATGSGDVAFVKHTTVKENTDGHNKLKWAKDLKSEDFELLCPKGGRAAIDKYEECNMAKVPRSMIVTSNAKSAADIDEIRHVMVTASQLFSKRPDIFKMFGAFEGKQDLLFKDSTTGLVSYDQDIEQEYKKILVETTC